MKNIFKILLLIIVVCLGAVVFSACTGCKENKTFSLIYTAGEGGSIEGDVCQTVHNGESGTEVVAVAGDGFEFVQWSDGVTTQSRTDKNVSHDINVTARFAKAEYFTITYDAGEGGSIEGLTQQTVKSGESGQEVTAVPNEGYRFVKWSDGKTLPKRQDKITEDCILTAEFEFFYEGGDGTASNPFTITNYTHLKNMWYYPESNFKLLNDLDLSGVVHEPIFDKIRRFAGQFDGGGFTIKNLTIETEKNFPSIFGFVYNGKIGNLNVENINISAFNYNTEKNNTNYCIGIIAGVANGFMHDLNVSGKISGNKFDYDYVTVGGIAGMGYGTFENCNSDIRIEISNAHSEMTTDFPFIFGGLIGVSDSAYIKSCVVEGNITVTDSSNYLLIGGLVGYYFTNQSTETYIDNSETFVSIFTNSGKVGGFIGNIDGIKNSSLSISDCSVHGDIKARVASGFIYSAYLITTNIENCYTDNDIVGYGRAAGFICEAKGIALTNCKAMGNVSSRYINGGNLGSATGFCYQISSSTMRYCCAIGNVTATDAFGFAYLVSDCNFEQCYSSGEVTAVLHSAGFLFSLNRGNIINCYSISNVYNINEDEKAGRTLVAGFAVSLSDVNMENSYYGGELFGTVYAQGVGAYPMVATFVGFFDKTNILNCHTLHNENGYALNVIAENRNDQEEVVSLTVYTEKSDMFFLAGLLNKDSDKQIWVNCQNNFPQLIM